MAVAPLTVLLLLLMVAPAGWCQASNNQPVQPGTYYLDSNADCNGPIREIYGQTVRVVGHGTIQEQQSPQSCTLQLRSSSAMEQTQLRIQVVAATIRDCDVRLTVFDGDPGQSTLRGYDCNTPNKPNERDLVTTGDLVSFTLTRRDSVNTLFDIELYITPLVSGNRPGYENDYGDAWGFFREKPLENDEAIGIVGAIFLITIILVSIGMICCYRRFLGKNKPWEQHQLSAFQPDHSIYETKSKMSDTSSGVWASNMSRSQAQPGPRHRVEPTRHMARPSEDEDSVFDDASDVPPKKQLMDRDRRWQREREHERERARGKSRDYASQNNSFVQADDDHPQDTFVERVITPRVRPSRTQKPPSYREALEESETEKSELEEEEDSDDVDHKETSEEESEEPSSEEEESDEEEVVKKGAAAPKPAPRPKAQPPPPPPPPPPPQQPNTVHLPPGMAPPGAYPAYPPMGYPVPQGQFVPVMAPPPGQPYPGMGPGYPPPRYQSPPQAPQSTIRPTDPPIYSYLVQRGYTPLDISHDSPSSLANTSQSQASADDSDKNILSPGVEYMRR